MRFQRNKLWDYLHNAITVVMVVLFVSAISYPYLVIEYPTIRVTKTEHGVAGRGENVRSVKFVYANGTRYEVSDSFLDMQFSSGDLFGRFEVGRVYQVRTRGIRLGLLSMQPNIVDIVKEVHE